MASSCRSCNAGILWAKTARGKAMPLDAEPVYHWDDLRGLMVVRDGVALPAVGAAPLDGEPVYRSHFATCEHAEEHRHART